MGNGYFRLLKNIKLGGKNKDIKKRNEGASLVYVLVILSIISAFSINFAYYVRQKKEMVFLKSQKENNVEKKYLIQNIYGIQKFPHYLEILRDFRQLIFRWEIWKC